MNIVVASDENYILPTKVMLTSFLLNNRQEHHNIYFLYSAVKKESVDELIGLVGKYDAQLIPVMISESDFEGFACLGPYTIETYYRLVIPHILPDTEERALWMDVDIVVDGALDEFYYQELGEYAIAACRDIVDSQHKSRLVDLGAVPGAVYVNAGVCLFNLSVMRKYQLADYYEYYMKHQQHIYLNDQDIINGLFSTAIKVWEQVPFNVQIANVSLTYPTVPNGTKIIHYIGSPKPWGKGYLQSAGKIWDRYSVIATEKKGMHANIYMIKGYVKRAIEYCLYPLRVLHGMIHDRWR